MVLPHSWDLVVNVLEASRWPFGDTNWEVLRLWGGQQCARGGWSWRKRSERPGNHPCLPSGSSCKNPHVSNSCMALLFMLWRNVTWNKPDIYFRTYLCFLSLTKWPFTALEKPLVPCSITECATDLYQRLTLLVDLVLFNRHLIYVFRMIRDFIFILFLKILFTWKTEKDEQGWGRNRLPAAGLDP